MKAGITVALIVSVGSLVLAQAPDLKQQWEQTEREWEAAQVKPAQNTPVRGGTDGGGGTTPDVGPDSPDLTWPLGAGGAAVTIAAALAIAWRRKTTVNKDGSSTTEEEGTMAETITRVFPRGARPTPRHKLAAATPFQITGPTPAQVIVIPSFLEVWLNDTYGDCHDAQTEVLTEKGWQFWPEYDGRSLLGTMNQRSGMLEFQAPTALKRREHSGLMAYSDHARLDFAITPNHRLYHRPYSRSKGAYQPYQFGAVDSLTCQFAIPLATTGFVGTTLKRLVIGDREWDGDDLLSLLAVIVSDGCVGRKNAIEFVCFREDRYDKVAALAFRLGIREKPSEKGVWRFSDGALAEWLRANTFTGLEYRSPFKRVPDLVKVASQQQIGTFLDFFGDQTALSDGRRNFCSTSKRMMDDVQELLLRVGKAGTIYDGYSHKGVRIKGEWVECHNPCYTLHQAKHTEVCLHNVKDGSGASNLRWGDYKGEVFCATVPNSTLVTRRNGRVLVSSNCVTAEEAFAKAAYSVMAGLPETKITDATVLAFCNKYNVLNGADLTTVMDAMISDGFHQDAGYKNGPYKSVDYSNEPVLQNAISIGPVKIGIDANALPSGAGNKNGWAAIGGSSQYSNEDHCVALCGYGPSAALFQALGAQMPSGFPANGYLLFTWATIGVVDHAWIMSTVGEAWVRNPTTAGIAPVPPPIPPGPPPNPVPPVVFVPPFFTFEGQTVEGGPFPDPGTAHAAAIVQANADRVAVDVRDSRGNLFGTVPPGPAPGPSPGPGPSPNSAVTITVSDPLAPGSYEVFPVGTKEKFSELATLIAALGGGGKRTF